MKKLKILLFSIVLVFTSCGTLKKYDAQATYLKSEIINLKKSYLLIDEKTATRNILTILYGADSINSNYNEIVPKDSFRSKFINADDWLYLYNSNVKNTKVEVWNSSDFKNLYLELTPKLGLYNTKFLDKYMNNEKRILWLSKPIYIKQKKLVFFCFSESDTFKNLTIHPHVVIMKKKEGKWIVIDKVFYNGYF